MNRDTAGTMLAWGLGLVLASSGGIGYYQLEGTEKTPRPSVVEKTESLSPKAIDYLLTTANNGIAGCEKDDVTLSTKPYATQLQRQQEKKGAWNATWFALVDEKNKMFSYDWPQARKAEYERKFDDTLTAVGAHLTEHQKAYERLIHK